MFENTVIKENIYIFYFLMYFSFLLFFFSQVPTIWHHLTHIHFLGEFSLCTRSKVFQINMQKNTIKMRTASQNVIFLFNYIFWFLLFQYFIYLLMAFWGIVQNCMPVFWLVNNEYAQFGFKSWQRSSWHWHWVNNLKFFERVNHSLLYKHADNNKNEKYSCSQEKNVGLFYGKLSV